MIAHKDDQLIMRSRMDMVSRQVTARARHLAGGFLAIAAFVGLACFSTAWAADPPAAQPSIEPPRVSSASPAMSMLVTVREEKSRQQEILLLAGRSVVIDLSEPMARCQIADPEVAAVNVLSPQQIVVTSKRAGSTQLIVWDAKEGQVTMPVTVQLDLAELEAAIKKLAPKATVQVQALRERVLLTGMVPDSDTADAIDKLTKAFVGELGGRDAQRSSTTGQGTQSSRVMNHMTVAGVHQVLLRCTVAEVSKSAIRKLGVNGWLAGDNVRDVFMVNNLDGINPSNIGAVSTGNILGPQFTTGAPTESMVFGTPGIPTYPAPTGPEFTLGFPRIQMQLFFRAMRDNRLLRVLAEPNLIALSGQEANFLAGGEFPVPIPQGLGTTTIEWKKFGVLLRFTPTVIGQQRIRLNVRPEVSERDFTTQVTLTGGTTVPGIKARNAETTVELVSGSTIAIAGLLNEEIQAAARRIPGLGDVPVLGALFSSVEYQRNQTELVILVTPELVAAMNPDQVGPVPGQFMTDPSDYELFGLGMLEGKPVAEAPGEDAALETGAAPKYRKFRTSPEQLSLHGPWGQAQASETIQ
ncbi:MAG TPA: type II and III secretion system protein family protein [Phycisphaerae bacterium]|nr:type II and III secretion system protein family protein [Phycisphaerae bacterium]HRY66934.1 type II and III secretion system protein family protein [Phycisphaerae bacterium]HSA27882.1 type II and III secretion system protein family protein [Phycisphaerae bacterium]